MKKKTAKKDLIQEADNLSPKAKRIIRELYKEELFPVYGVPGELDLDPPEPEEIDEVVDLGLCDEELQTLTPAGLTVAKHLFPDFKGE